MSTPFGPQLIGETEKTLNALLLRHLDGTGLTEPQWVTLRLSDQCSTAPSTPTGSSPRSPTAPTSRDADRLVDDLDRARAARATADRPSAGRELLTAVQAAVATDVGSDLRGPRDPTTSPPPRACSTRWSAAPALPWRRRPRSPRDRRADAAPLDRALETGGDDRGGDVAAGALEHGAQRVGGAAQPAGERVGVVDR